MLFNIFTTREIATGIYLLLFLIICTTSKEVRKYLVNIVRIACSPKMSIPFIVLLLYAAAVVYGFTYLPFWEWIYLKDVILWVIVVGVPVCYNAFEPSIEEHYFKNMIVCNFKFSVFLEFFMNTFTFSLIVELIMQAVLILLTLLQTVSGINEETKYVKKLLDVIITILGVVLIYQTAKVAVCSYPNYDIKGWTISLLIPIVFSILYLPAAHIMAVISRYELLLLRLNYTNEKKKLKFKYKLRIICLCKLSIKNINLFRDESIKIFYHLDNEDDFYKLVDNYKLHKQTKRKI